MHHKSSIDLFLCSFARILHVCALGGHVSYLCSCAKLYILIYIGAHVIIVTFYYMLIVSHNNFIMRQQQALSLKTWRGVALNNAMMRVKK